MGLQSGKVSATLTRDSGETKHPMAKKIRVTILDDHQSTVDGYHYRLGDFPNIEIVDTLRFGEELGPSLRETPDRCASARFQHPYFAGKPEYLPDTDRDPQTAATLP